MKKITALLMSAILAAGILLTGCGGGTSTTAKPEGSSESAGGGGAQQVKTFVFPADQDLPDMLPVYGEDSRTAMIRPLYDFLYIINNGETRYYLADKLEVSEDGLHISLHLNEKAKWHDGTPVTVDDILFTLRYRAEGAISPDTSLLKIDDEPINYEKVDDYTLNITLPQPLSKFVTVLGRMMPYPAHVFGNDPTKVTGSPESMLGIGNGPFKMEAWNKGESIIYTKNEDYYRGAPKVDQVIMKVMPDDSAKEVALQNGEISFMRVSNKEKYEKYASSDQFNVYESPECRVNYLTCNPVSSKITSKEAREAIFYAINLQEIMDTVYGSDILSKPGTTIFCDQNNYFDSTLGNYTHDLEKATQLAKDSGLDQVTLKYVYNNNRVNMPEVAVVVQQQLKKAGINVELQAMDSPSFFAMFFGWSRGGATDEWDLGTNGWDSLQGDPSTQIISYALNAESTNCSQLTQDTLVNATHAATDAERDRLYKEAQKLIQDDFTVYPISCPNYVWVTQKNVKGLADVNSMIPFEDYLLIDVE